MFRSRPLRLTVIALAALAWVVAPVAAMVHEIVVPHSICPEHGELVELALVANSPSADAPSDRAAAGDQAPDTHDDGCVLDGFSAHSSTPSSAAIWAIAIRHAPTSVARALGAAPRAPPLTYAPKTSPPSGSLPA